MGLKILQSGNFFRKIIFPKEKHLETFILSQFLKNLMKTIKRLNV